VSHSAPRALIEIRRLRKRVGGRPLLDIPELYVHPGTCTVLSGRNGAGKTTLLKILAGLDAPDHAEVRYDGLPLPWSVARQRFSGSVIYLHQYPYLFDRSVSENIAYGLRRQGCPRGEVPGRVATALEWAGLAHLAARNARELSGGERQRVALTRAWVLSPRLLLLDEPLASMDRESREHTYFLIRRLRAEGIALIIASHDLQHLCALSDRHLHLQDGALQVYNGFARAGTRQPSGSMADPATKSQNAPAES
jgi:tungstate transport system ATP-binding protein